MSQEHRVFTFIQEPRDAEYRHLLGEGLRRCKLASLVRRKMWNIDSEAQRIVDELRALLRAEREVFEWPGTRLFDETALLYEYEFSEKAQAILIQAANGLYEWTHPRRPEDLILWRAEGDPWLVTIAHEHDGYLLLTPQEAQDIAVRLPSLAALWKEEKSPLNRPVPG